MAFAYDFADGIKCFLISICSRFAAVCQKFFLLLLLGVEHIEVNQSFVHADGILPVVGRRCILAGILDAYFITFQHFFEQIVEAYRTHCLTHEIGSLHTFFHLIGNHITPVASGESHYESKVALFHTAQIDRKVFLHFQGDIILIVFGRFAIGGGIYAEHGEVTAVAGPHPVVCVGSKLSDGRRGSTHHADILVDGLYKKIVTVCSVERFQLQGREGSDFYVLLLGKAFGHFAKVRRGEVVQAFRVLVLSQLFFYIRSDIQNFVDKSNGQPLARQFLLAGHRPESVCQVVVLHRTVLLDISVSAMVIGQHQSFC